MGDTPASRNTHSVTKQEFRAGRPDYAAGKGTEPVRPLSLSGPGAPCAAISGVKGCIKLR
jgi:hypothetical protein